MARDLVREIIDHPRFGFDSEFGMGDPSSDAAWYWQPEAPPLVTGGPRVGSHTVTREEYYGDVT